MIRCFKIGLLLLTLAALAACKKTVTGKYYVYNADALSYVQLKQGKYFVYRDSVSGNTDSVVVTQSLLEQYDSSMNGVPYDSQQFSLTLTQINKGAANTTWLKGMSPGYQLARLQIIAADNPANYYFIDIAPVLPSMVVEGKTYTSVNVTINQQQGTSNVQGSFKTAYYWSKNVGLIKRTETIGGVTNTYNLLRHN